MPDLLPSQVQYLDIETPYTVTFPSGFESTQLQRATLVGPITPVSFGAVLTSPTTLILALGTTPVSVVTTVGNYTITGPSSITVTNVAWVSGSSYVTLTVSGTFQAGVYSVSLTSQTFVDVSGDYNIMTPVPVQNTLAEFGNYGATLVTPTKIEVGFGVVLSSVNTTAARYTISGPSSITVNSVSFTGGNTFLELNVTGTFVAGSYTLTIQSGTTTDVNGVNNNPNATPILNTSGLSALEYSAVVVSLTQIVLAFGEVLAGLNATTSRYVISGPSAITIGSVVYNPGDTFAIINFTGAFVAGVYTITIASGSFSDPSGNSNTTAPEPVLNTSGSSSPPFIDGITPDPSIGVAPMQPVSFNIKDGSGLFRQIIVLARFVFPDNTEVWDVIWDGVKFAPLYRNPYTTATSISLGYALTVLREGGWPTTLALTAYAIDKTGGENP